MPTFLTPDNTLCPLHWLVGTDQYALQFCQRTFGDPRGDVSKNILLQAAALSQMRNRIIVKLILNWGADVDSSNGDGHTPLHLAVCSRNADNVNTFINEGAYLNPRDSSGRTPLHFAVCKSYSYLVSPFPISYCDMSIVERLVLERRIGLNHGDREGETPLMYAVRERNACAVRALLRRLADPNIPNRHNVTPLHVALSSRRVSMSSRARIVYALLENGAGIYCLDNSRRTPIDRLLRNVDDDSVLEFASYCLKKIALRHHVRESLKSKVRPIPYLDHCLGACCEEVDLMRRLVICDHGTLHDFALGWFPTGQLEDPVTHVYRPVVEMLLVFRFPIYRKSITRRLSRTNLAEVLKSCLGMPDNFVLEPHYTKRFLCGEIHAIYLQNEELQMRLQRFRYVL